MADVWEKRVCELPVAGGKFISPLWSKFVVTGDFGAIESSAVHEL